MSLPCGVDVKIVSGCPQRPSSKAAASEEARRTLRYVEPLSDARTPLADFFSFLLEPVLSPGRPFSFGLLDERHVRLRRPYVRETSSGFDLEHLATAFMKNLGYGKIEQASYLI